MVHVVAMDLARYLGVALASGEGRALNAAVAFSWAD